MSRSHPLLLLMSTKLKRLASNEKEFMMQGTEGLRADMPEVSGGIGVGLRRRMQT